MIYHLYTTQGNRPYQEDVYIIKNYLSNDLSLTETENFSRLNVDLFGVFDGHGGGEISKAVSKTLPQYFYKQNMMNDNCPKPISKYTNYIVSTFDNLQNDLNAKHSKSTLQGTTVCLCLVYDFKGKKYITAMWTGDSRAIACNQKLIAESLTLDHKPDMPLERFRIQKLGGEITFEKNDVPRINGVLAVSRALGDFDQKKYVEHKPDVNHYYCDYKFIVVATDGLWDVMDNQTVCNIIYENIINNPKILECNKTKKSDTNIATKLADKAIELGSDDNITIIIYFLDTNINDYIKYINKSNDDIKNI